MSYNWRDKVLAGNGRRVGFDKAKGKDWTIVEWNAMNMGMWPKKYNDLFNEAIAGAEIKPGCVVQLVEHGGEEWEKETMRLRKLETDRGLFPGSLGMPNLPKPRLEALPVPNDFVGFMNHTTIDPSVTSDKGVLTLEKLNEFCALVFGQSYHREKPLPTIDLMNALTKLFLPENTRTLLEAGYVDTNMTLTPKGRDALNAITLLSNMEALVQSARDTIAEAKANKE